MFIQNVIKHLFAQITRKNVPFSLVVYEDPQISRS